MLPTTYPPNDHDDDAFVYVGISVVAEEQVTFYSILFLLQPKTAYKWRGERKLYLCLDR